MFLLMSKSLGTSLRVDMEKGNMMVQEHVLNVHLGDTSCNMMPLISNVQHKLLSGVMFI